MEVIKKERDINMNFDDRDITCVSCGNVFTFSAKEQEFFYDKKFEDPKRCPDCRKNDKNKNSGKVPAIEPNKNFSMESFGKLIGEMLTEYNFVDGTDFSIKIIESDKRHVFQVNLSSNEMALMLLYNGGEIANFIRGYVKSVGRINGYLLNIDIKKPSDSK